MPSEEWAFQARTACCASCARTFAVGDAYYGALFQKEARLIRQDFCEPCWSKGRPEGCLSYWRNVVPEPEEVEKRKRRLDASLNTDALFEVLRETPDDPDPGKRRFRFVLSLMLVRRRKLKLLQIARRKTALGEESFLVLSVTGRGRKEIFEVADVKMNEQEMIAAQDEVGRLLALGGVEEALAGSTAAARPAAAGQASAPEGAAAGAAGAPAEGGRDSLAVEGAAAASADDDEGAPEPPPDAAGGR